MKKDQIIYATILIILSSVLISGCVQTNQSTQSSSKGFSSAVITEHTYLFGDEGLFTKKYDLTVLILTKPTDYKDLSKEQLQAYLGVYGLDLTSSLPPQTSQDKLTNTPPANTQSNPTTFSSSEFVKPGDTVVVDFTLYDATGNPVITSNQQVYTNHMSDGKGVILCKQLSLTSDKTLTKEIYPVSAAESTQQFAVFSTEYNAISTALVGMKTGDQKHIAIPSNISMTQEWSAEQLQRNKVNINDLQIGNTLAMGVSDAPEAMTSGTSAITYTRMGEIVSKTDVSVIVDFGYPYADISVISINGK